MALFGRDYDESYRTGSWSDRGNWGGSNPRWGRGDHHGGYGSPYPGWTGRDRFGTTRYSTDYDTRFGSNQGHAYDRGYKSRWQTDYGDPYGDRQQHTPMRVIRGGARGYDNGFWSSNEYDRNLRGSGYPMGYQPYSVRAGYDTGFMADRNYRSYGRGYDRGWY